MPTTIDWDAIREKLPTEKTADQKTKRSEIFNRFDENGTGYLSLAEVDKGCRDVLGLYDIFECKKVIMRAFQAAKSVSSSKNDRGPDYVRLYFELWLMFDDVDGGEDDRIGLDEFKSAVPKIQAWGVKIEDPEATFAEIDVNGGGQVLFNEFAEWAIKKGLDLEDSDE